MMEYRGCLGRVEFDEEAVIFHGEVINIRDVSLRCGQCRNFMTLSAYEARDGWNAYTFECDGGGCGGPAVLIDGEYEDLPAGGSIPDPDGAPAAGGDEATIVADGLAGDGGIVTKAERTEAGDGAGWKRIALGIDAGAGLSECQETHQQRGEDDHCVFHGAIPWISRGGNIGERMQRRSSSWPPR